jgi:hypothetical protein
MASEVRRCRRTRVGTAGALLQVHAFQLWWWGMGARFRGVHSRSGAVGYQRWDGLGSRLNVRERR